MVAPCQQAQPLSTARIILSSRQRCDALGISFVSKHYIQRECWILSLVAYHIGDTSRPGQFADRSSLDIKFSSVAFVGTALARLRWYFPLTVSRETLVSSLFVFPSLSHQTPLQTLSSHLFQVFILRRSLHPHP